MAGRKRVPVDGSSLNARGWRGTVDGWAIPVPGLFFDRMDIALTVLGGRRVWTQGAPPAYSWALGDVLYDPPAVRTMRWGDALAILQRAVVVTGAQADAIDGSQVVPGWVEVTITDYADGVAAEVREARVSQADFVHWLRVGGPEPVPGDGADLTEQPVDGQVIAIEYVDAKMEASRRRIVVREIEPLDEHVWVRAVCLERRALRSFRLDRIQCVIDGDGVVHDPAEFFCAVVAI